MLDSETRADSNTLAERVLPLFFARLDTYGRELAGGKASTDKAQVTPALIQAHLDGQVRIGAHSTTLDNLCRWGCLDLDHTGHDKPLSPEEYARLLALGPVLVRKGAELGITLYLELSKRGAWHVWLFCAEPIPAGVLRLVLRYLLAECGLPFPRAAKSGGPHGAVEVFPGQDDVRAGFGNWVYLPYFARGAGGRSVIVSVQADDTLTPLALEDLLAQLQRVPPSRLQVVSEWQESRDRQQSNGHAQKQTAPEEEAQYSPVLNHLATRCWRFRDALATQRSEGLEEPSWFNWCHSLTVAGYAQAAEEFSRLSAKHNRRSEERIGKMKQAHTNGTAVGPVRCTTFGCGQAEIRQCFSGLLWEREGEITNTPPLHFRGSFRGFGGFSSQESGKSEAPRPLRRPLPAPAPYPIDALGGLGGLAAVAKKLHATIQAPLALCGQSVLAATALAVQAYADIHIDGRVMPLSAYFLTVGESGERKSAVDREALLPHRAYEKTLVDQYEQECQGYENDFAAFKKAREEALKKAKTREEKKRTLDAIGPAPEAPLSPVLTSEEPTYEGLIKLLLYGYPSLGLFADEGGRFVGGYGMSEDHQLKTASGLSELWDGKRISRVRGGDGAVLLYGRRVSMHLMMQPQVAQRMLGNPLLIDQGFMSRCLVTWPESTAGTRLYAEVNLREDQDLIQYNKKITKMLNTPLLLAGEKRNELAPLSLTLSVVAKALWVKFHNAVEGRLSDNQPFSSIRGFANKAPEHALRLAGVLTLYEDLKAKEISANHMRAGIDLAQHYLDEALRLFHSSQTDPDLILAEKLLTWVQQRGEHVALVDIYQRGLNAISDAATARRLVKILEAHGWFVPVPGGKEIDGQFRREVWEVKK